MPHIQQKTRTLTLNYEISYPEFRRLMILRFSEIHDIKTKYYYARMPDYDTFVIGYHHYARTAKHHKEVMHDTELHGKIRVENGKTVISYYYNTPASVLPFLLLAICVFAIGCANAIANQMENLPMVLITIAMISLVVAFFGSGCFNRMELMSHLKDLLEDSKAQ